VTKRDGTPWSPRVGGFLLAETLSAIGSMATMVAIWAFAAYKYDATPGEVALFGVAFSLPGVLLGPITGLVVDRLGPKGTLFGAKALGVVASLLLVGAHDFKTLAMLSALHGVSQAFSRPALQSLPPRLVDDEHLARTNALVGLTDQLSIVLGPVAAGVAIAAFGFSGAFVFDAFTYALGILVLPIVHLRPVPVAEGADPNAEAHVPGLRDALEGWKMVGRTPILRRVVACAFSVHLLYGTAMLAEPLYVRDVLERSTNVFASLQSVFGVFLVLGGLVAARLGDRMATFGWVALGVIASGGTAILYLGTELLGVAFLGVSLWGVATAIIWGPSTTVLQRNSPSSHHGRVMAAEQLAANLAMFLGLGLAGVLISLVGVQPTMTTLGLSVAGIGTLLYLADRRDHTTPTVEPDAPVEAETPAPALA